MTKPQRPRVDLDPNIFKAIVIEATRQGKKPKDLIDLWVRENASPEVLALLDITPLPKSTNVPTIVPLPEGDKAPLSISPPSSEPLNYKPLNSDPLLNSEEKIVLEHLQANRTYREIQELEKGKSNVTKSKVQSMVQKFIGMGIYQKGKRGPKKQSLK